MWFCVKEGYPEVTLHELLNEELSGIFGEEVQVDLHGER